MSATARRHGAIGWNLNWIDGTPLGNLDHPILYDYAVHWFDLLSFLLDDCDPTRVYLLTAYSPTQTSTPPLLAQALIEYKRSQAALTFDGYTRYDGWTRTYVTGTAGTIVSRGPSIDDRTVELTTGAGTVTPVLEGQWFPDGFCRSMTALVAVIEEDCEPVHSARDDLSSLQLCFAAVESAEIGNCVDRVPFASSTRAIRSGLQSETETDPSGVAAQGWNRLRLLENRARTRQSIDY